jgi:hypothetical protein
MAGADRDTVDRDTVDRDTADRDTMFTNRACVALTVLEAA